MEKLEGGEGGLYHSHLQIGLSILAVALARSRGQGGSGDTWFD